MVQERPRVLVLTSTFPRWDGDSEPRFVLDLCRHLAMDAEILVIAPRTPGASREETIEGIRVRRFSYFWPRWEAIAYRGGIMARLRENKWRILQLPFFLAGLWWASRREILTWRPDIIHAHWILPQGIIACLTAPRGLPVLCTSHGGDLHGLRGRLFRALKSWTLNRCAAVTVVSDSMVPLVRRLAPEGVVETIPMGTDLAAVFTPPDASTARERHGIVFAGRLVEKKGLRHLLDALALLKDLDVGLTIAGDGPLKSELLNHAQACGVAERVRFLGNVPQQELAQLYQTAILAVFPFTVASDGDQEGFGLVVVESMGCGCPVIAGHVPAVRQSIEPGVTGLLVEPGNANALASAIRNALADDSLRNRLAEAALIHARKSFTWPSVAVRYQALFGRLLRS